MIEPGFVPKGWKQGEPLKIWQAGRSGPRGAVFRELPPLKVEDACIDDIACFEFTYSDAIQLKKWLKWWNPEIYGNDK
jgi:hypothetical protein